MIPIKIEHITKRFGETVALDRVCLEIAAGEIFFLLGPSGCGKTTLLRSIAGFIEPDEGRIWFGSEDITRLPPHKRNTGMMFQSYALWPHMSVQKNVAFGLEERRVGRKEQQQRVEEALDAVQMRPYAARKINQLSGGQQQRVALARALVIRPRALLLDEPLSNLDAKLRLEMRQEIRRACREFDLTAIYVTHDQKEALSIADRLAVLDQGRVRQAGPPAEVYERPASRFVADFIGETNFLTGTLLSHGGQMAQVETDAGLIHGRAAPGGDSLRTGEQVTVSIRPESLRLLDRNQSPNGANVFSGRIRDVIYLGEMAQYTFHSSGHDLKITELNPRFSKAPGEGEMSVHADPEDVVILRG